MVGGPGSPMARSGVDGLLMRSSISETEGRRTSEDGRRRCGTRSGVSARRGRRHSDGDDGNGNDDSEDDDFWRRNEGTKSGRMDD